MASNYTATDAHAYQRLMGRWSRRLAKELIAFAGIEAGDRVGTLAGNSIEYYLAVIAVLKTGAIVVPMSTRLTIAELELGIVPSEMMRGA